MVVRQHGPASAASSEPAPPASPPTDRVVRVLRLLSEQESGATVTEIAERLDLNRSTTTAIVTTLAQWGWVARRGPHVYGLGDGLLALAEAVRQRLPLLPLANVVLERLTAETGFRSTLSSADNDHITIIAAWSSAEERTRWMDGSDVAVDERPELDRFLDSMRANGFGARRFDSANQPALTTIQQLVMTLDESPEQANLREELVRLLHSYGGTGYTYDELAGDGTLGVSYLVAPVFEAGLPRYQLELHVLRGAMERAELRRCVDLLLAAADELTTAAGRP